MVVDVDSIFDNPSRENEFFIAEDEDRLTPRIIVKASDETITNSETMQDDDELFMSVSADSTYYFKVSVQALSSNVGLDLDFTFTAPAGSTARFWRTVDSNNLETDKIVLDFGTESILGDTTTTAQTFEAEGFIKTGNTAGNLQFQWAMNNAVGGESTTIKEASFLQATRQ